MDMSMTHRIDDVDRAIVKQLQQDGRMSSARIARRIGGITERAVRYRIDRLIRDGVIRVRAIVNPRALGRPVMGDITLEVESGHVQEVAQRVAQFDCVGYVAFSMGEKDISLQAYTRDNDELYRFATEVLGKLPWVTKTTTLIVPQKLKDIDDWQMPSSSCATDEGEPNRSSGRTPSVG
jgi:Lrp/AsnC family transcriptional regulator for asnA, asnC and gidA